MSEPTMHEFFESQISGEPLPLQPIEETIAIKLLRQLMLDLTFSKKYLTVVKADFFNDGGCKYGPVYEELARYINTYECLPTKEQLIMELVDANNLDDGNHELIRVANTIASGTPDVRSDDKPNYIDNMMEAFILRRWNHSTIIDWMQATEAGKHGEADEIRLRPKPSFTNEVPGIFTGSPDFLNQLRNFDKNKEAVIPFDIKFLNDALRGVRKKTLSIVLGGTSVGKSLFLCHLTASYMRRGLNVVYFSMEMEEEIVIKRVYANLLDTPLDINSELTIDDDVTLPDGLGLLHVQNFASGSGHVGMFRKSLATMKSKRNFAPTIIVVDYLAICASIASRGNGTNPQHVVMQAIAQELRALAQQTDTVVWTGAQTNREGMGKGVTVNLTHTAGAVQINYDADLVMSLSEIAEIPEYYLCRIEKHRNGPRGQQGVLFVNRPRMRVYDPSAAQHVAFKEACDKLTEVQKAKPKKKPPPEETDF